MTNFYVYAYLRNRDSETAPVGSPYYIGKGKNNRAYDKHKNTPTPNDKEFIVILKEGLDEAEAHQFEIELIKKYGRKDIGTGILHNRTDGGEGASGAQGQVPWNKGKKGLQEAWNKGKTGYLTDEQRSAIGAANKARGPQSAETIAKRSAAMIGKNKGKIHSVEQNEKHSQTMKGRVSPLKGRVSPLKGRSGRQWTDEEKAAKSAAMKGRGWTEARRAAQLKRKEK